MNIYLIHQDNSDLYKIGVSKHTKKRLNEHQTGNGNKLHIIVNVPCKFCYKLETALHNRFGLDRKNGDWFELKREDVINFEKYCNETEEIFKVLKENNMWVQNTNWL